MTGRCSDAPSRDSPEVGKRVGRHTAGRRQAAAELVDVGAPIGELPVEGQDFYQWAFYTHIASGPFSLML
jgi:hypothetical protein